MNAVASQPRCAIQNGVVIVQGEHNTFAVMVPGHRDPRILKIAVDYCGFWYREDWWDAREPYRDCLDVDLRECAVRVWDRSRYETGDVWDVLLAELVFWQPQGARYEPWMVVQGEQTHVTENYVAVPPALHLTDAAGARWTLGFHAAEKGQSPQGEFAFAVLRNGIDTGAIASRLELKNGMVRCFTRRGWKRWLGREWS